MKFKKIIFKNTKIAKVRRKILLTDSSRSLLTKPKTKNILFNNLKQQIIQTKINSKLTNKKAQFAWFWFFKPKKKTSSTQKYFLLSTKSNKSYQSPVQLDSNKKKLIFESNPTNSMTQQQAQARFVARPKQIQFSQKIKPKMKIKKKRKISMHL